MANDCDPIKFYPPSDVFGGEKPVPSCLPAPVRPPDELKAPEGESPVVSPIQRPRAINVTNFEATAVCEDGSIGNTIITPSGTLTGTVPFSKALTIDDSVLNYIATNDLVSWIEGRITDPTFTAVELSDTTGMRLTEAETLLTDIRSLQDTLTESAESLAQASLVCYWENEVQIAECADPAMAKPDENPDAVFRVVVPAGLEISYISQADANAKALQRAEDSLNCFYASDPIVVDCTTRPDRPLDEMEPVPTDTVPVYPGRPLRVGSYNVLVGKFTSTISKEDANEQAANFGYSQLVCYYVNNEVYLECEDPDARNAGVSPSEPPVVADPETSTSGQSVTIPKGYITSDISTEEATTEANNLATSLLECCFVNKELHVECPPFELLNPDGTPVLDKYGNPVKIPASQTASPVWSYDIPAGTHISCESQEAADALAESDVAGVLDCYYCNQIVLPTCVPDWVILAVTDGILMEDGTVFKLTLPLDATNLINPYTKEPEDLSKWSIDATAGMSADTFCSPEFIQSQQIADNAGQEKVEKVADTRGDCQFANDLVIAACASEDPYDPENPILDHTGYTPSGELYRFYSRFSADACLDGTLTSPEPGAYIEIPAETIVVTALDTPGTLPDDDPGYNKAQNDQLTKEYANKMAFQMATSLLYCLFTNPVTQGICEAESFPTKDGEICTDQWIIGGNKSVKGLSPDSNTATNPMVVSARMFMSAESLEAVHDEVEQFVLSNMYCMYCNEQQTASCPPNLTQLTKAVVPQCTYVMESLEAANAAAKSLAESMVACLDPTVIEPIPGPPGADGKDGEDGKDGTDGKDGQDGQCTGGDCQGECYGVYS